MHPLLIVQETKTALLAYLEATFHFREEALEAAFAGFLNGRDEDEGIFKGPYVSLKLPYRQMMGGMEAIPLEIKPGFVPFLHQARAFERLSLRNGAPLPTLVTTGTGSGKTEAFLFPLLDACFLNKDQPGIKAIILYPMNALATDQAGRIAEYIDKDSRLKGNLSVGLFIGAGSSSVSGRVSEESRGRATEMGATHVIEDKQTILDSPPDILLTNFKMLDYALLRHNYHRLWVHNLKHPELLRFLVLDELHTYDGAQGSDVANLIRRLKLKLQVPKGQLCPVGTSATIGSGADAVTHLVDFATRIFGETFDAEAIIGETRMALEDFFAQGLVDMLPDAADLHKAFALVGEEYDSYVQRQCMLWGYGSGISPVGLGQALKGNGFLANVLRETSREVQTLADLVTRLERSHPGYAQLAPLNQPGRHVQEALAASMLALVSYAKIPAPPKLVPLLFLQVQLWIREVSGLMRLVQEAPAFAWRTDLGEVLDKKGLPPWFCRECGASGWVGVKNEDADHFEQDPDDAYRKYFDGHKNLYFILTAEAAKEYSSEYEGVAEFGWWASQSLAIVDQPAEGRFAIAYFRNLRPSKAGNLYHAHFCPICNSQNTLTLVGQRVASLASVALGQLMTSGMDDAPEQQRKLLAFSNGVQDAAHRAAFFEARTFRFVLRTAIQRVVQEYGVQSVPELYRHFMDYWKRHADATQAQPLEGYLYKFFPPEHQGRLKIAAFKTGTDQYEADFVREFDLRMLWEISTEYGYNATIGRTLEKTGTSATFFKEAGLRQVFALMQPWLAANQLGEVDEARFLLFANGLLHRLRMRGGLDHPFMEKFRTEKSSYFLLTQGRNPQHLLLKNFGKNTRLPKLLTDQVNTFGVFDLTTQTGSKTNWFHSFFKRSFIQNTLLMGDERLLINEFYSTVLEALTQEGLLDRKEAAGIRNYALNPNQLWVGAEVGRFVCGVCEHDIYVAHEGASLTVGMACLQFKCAGAYDADTAFVPGYYQAVYNRGRLVRIYSAEHTGMLDRDLREGVETDFKTRPHHNSVNTLVATSTLEMGIDIGDLNVAFNTDIPPTPSNYLQRVGRAGRKSGNAAVLSFVDTKPHALFYFEDPLEMLAGDVSSPGCYLEAKDILKRHFTAFCIDTWTGLDPVNHSIPRSIKDLKVEWTKADAPELVFNQWIAFINADVDDLFNRFHGQYLEHETPAQAAAFRQLYTLVNGGQLSDDLSRIVVDLQAEIGQLKSRKGAILDHAKALPTTAPEQKELKSDLYNVNNAIRLFYDRMLLEHLTNIGILPNYAFPETGVTLQANLRRWTGKGGDFESEALEIVRPASSAIREMAPENFYYVHKNKYPINGINVLNWKEEALEYRFCSRCDHLAQHTGTPSTPCPKCKDESWQSPKNKHKFLMMRRMVSFVNSEDAYVGDTGEDRESKISSLSKHFVIPPHATAGAMILKEIPFGIEYLKNTTYFEVNTSLHHEKERGADIKINDVERSDIGYIVCRSCGKIADSNPYGKEGAKTAKDYHFGYCKHREHIYASAANDAAIFETVYLYRMLQTEALKILIPVQELDSDARIAMFKAGLMLGLRKYYGGNPQHLRMENYAEYNPHTGRKDRFLMMYDTIPGGTGYLNRLFDPVVMGDILQRAYWQIRDCGCQYQGKTGCYACVYTYTNQHDRQEISRAAAEEIFKQITSNLDQWVSLPDGFGNVPDEGRVEESELERFFISSLKKYCAHPQMAAQGWSLKEVRAYDRICYHLQCPGLAGATEYEIIPQFDLGTSQGVRLATRADFLIRTRSTRPGETASNKREPLPIAIYLDGYHFHASREHDRFPTDFERREAIRDSGQYHSWTLCWEDLEQFSNSLLPSREPVRLDELRSAVNPEIIDKMARQAGFPTANAGGIEARNNMERLLAHLSIADPDESERNARVLLFAMQDKLAEYQLSPDHLLTFVAALNMDWGQLRSSPARENYVWLNRLKGHGQLHVRLASQINTLKLAGTFRIQQVGGAAWEQAAWASFWRWYNVFQFLDEFVPELLIGSASIGTFQRLSGQAHAPEADDLAEILTEYDAAYHAWVRQFHTKGWTYGEMGYFSLRDQWGAITASAVLGIAELKVAIEPLDDRDRHLFEAAGYRVFGVGDFDLGKLE
jgi:DEAD/DEAH box helicase domain-containing protein